MNTSPQYNWQAEPEQYKSELAEMYLPEPGNWSPIVKILEPC